MIVESVLSLTLLLGPPVASGPAEGPAPDDERAAIVAAAVVAAQDRAVLERNNQAVPEYVRQLDALATIEDRLDTCGRAVQAELRMNLALAYLHADQTCGEVEAEPDAEPPALEFPRECGAQTDAKACAEQLLASAAAFGDSGPAGAEDLFAQAAGCPHAVESMTVERLYGTCVAEQYEAAVERWRASQVQPPREEEHERRPLPVPRWASVVGISVGAGAIAAGATLVAIDGRCPGGGDPRLDAATCPNVYNTDAGGAVLISVGALAVLGMGTVLAITEVQRKRSGQGSKAAAMRRRLDGVAAVTGWQAPRLRARP